MVGVSFVQKRMNRDRVALGYTRAEVLENAPPVLAFTTVALGGFRGLIANALWIRATDLQQEDKFFEMAQLAEWITKLEPRSPAVWIFQEWNMAWNISVKFKDFPDRWRWVERGIALLRDEALKYNPNEVVLYHELAWIFQNKMGANLDDASMYYKRAWAAEMDDALGGSRTNLQELINPATEELKARAKVLIEKYKLDPAFMKKVDEMHGPLEWRLPEAHAIYWAEQGLEQSRENPGKVNHDDLIRLRRVVYQSLQLVMHRGRLITEPVFDTTPNLDIIQKMSDAYLQAMRDEPEDSNNIARAYRNNLRDAVYFLYQYNRIKDATEWYKYLGEKYPSDLIIDGNTNSLPTNTSLPSYVLSRMNVDVSETDRNKVKATIGGLISNSYIYLIRGEDERAEGFHNMAVQV